MTEWNDTLTGDYLWTNMIVAEIFPTTTTPSSWSVWEELLSNMSYGDIPAFGNIAGRPYLNYSLVYSFQLKLLRKHERVMAVIEDSIGVPPAGVDVPSFPVSWRVILFQLIPREFGNEVKKNKLRNVAPAISHFSAGPMPGSPPPPAGRRSTTSRQRCLTCWNRSAHQLEALGRRCHLAQRP